jgi:oligoribonuclease
MKDKNARPTKILWMDLEMTGLDPDKDVIIELAVEVTDFEFNQIASFEAVIKHPEAILTNMNPWADAQHAKSGLTDLIRKEGRPEDEVKHELVGFIKAQFGNEMAILAGNSIHNDRLFISKWWPEVDALLHYRMLDVTSWKIYMQGKHNINFQKPEAHRAFEDIQGSIAELQYYLDWFKKHANPDDA